MGVPGQPAPPGVIPQFVDQAVAAGVACDGSGRPQAAMGIACDDVTGDGLLDLLIGSYYDDFNTLYVQQPGRLFLDATVDFGLRDPTFSRYWNATDACCDLFELQVRQSEQGDLPGQLRIEAHERVDIARFGAHPHLVDRQRLAALRCTAVSERSDSPPAEPGPDCRYARRDRVPDVRGSFRPHEQ